MKYAIDTISNSRVQFNAGVKPRKDANRTLVSLGYKLVDVSLKHLSIPLLNRILIYLKLMFAVRKINSADIVVVQYPLFLYNKLLERLALKRLCKKCNSVSFLIHDIDFIRSRIGSQYEVELLNLPSRLIVHTSKMQQVVHKSIKDKSKPLDILNLFDYYSDAPMISAEKLLELRYVVAFAGNLRKSKFIKSLSALSSGVEWHLYGLKPENLDCLKTVHYIDKFLPDNPTILLSGWGLVWDGESIDSCSGVRGEYLLYNSPHKCSLYLSRGIPLIVWKRSAMASYVMQENIGIAVDSLREAEQMILEMNEDVYKLIIANARRIGEKVRSGGFLSELT